MSEWKVCTRYHPTIGHHGLWVDQVLTEAFFYGSQRSSMVERLATISAC